MFASTAQVTESGNTSAVLQRLGSPADHLGNDHRGNVTPPPYVVPNIVHFIWFANVTNRKLTFINYVSIVSAHRIQKPDTIMLHCNDLPAGEWWDRLWKEVSPSFSPPLSKITTYRRSQMLFHLSETLSM